MRAHALRDGVPAPAVAWVPGWWPAAGRFGSRSRGTARRASFGARHPAVFRAALTVALSVVATAEEAPDRPPPTLEETVEYINRKLGSCRRAQVMRFSPPSTIVVVTPAFAEREEFIEVDGRVVDNYMDFPRIPGAFFEATYELANLELPPHVEAKPATDSVPHYSYAKRMLQSRDRYPLTYGGNVHRVFLLCRKGSRCSKLVKPEIPADWYAANHPARRGGSDIRWRVDPWNVGQCLLVCDSDAAERVARAVAHLVGESGGQAEAAQELF